MSAPWVGKSVPGEEAFYKSPSASVAPSTAVAALESVTEAPVVVMMTESEARAHVNHINDLVGSVGKLLVDLKKREGWKALGYQTWTECLNKEFDESRRHLYRLMNAEEVREDLGPIGHNVPESQLRELVDVPSEQRIEVYQEAKATAPDGNVTAKHIQEVKAIVIKPNKPKKPKKAVTAPEIPADDPYDLADDDDRFNKIVDQVNDAYNEFFPKIVCRLKEQIRPCDWGLALEVIFNEWVNIEEIYRLWHEFDEFEEKRKTALKKYNSQLRKAQ